MGHVIGFADFWGNVVRRLLGIAAAMLPARWWPWIDLVVPTTTSASLAGILTVGVAAGIGIPGFLSYAERAVSAVNAVALEAARQNPDYPNADALLRQAPQAFSALSLFLFLFTTLTGWATMYLGLTGLLRAVAPVVDEGFGDPILTGVDALARRTRRGTRMTLEHMQRKAMEGPEMPDRIMSGAPLGIAADFVIVASRRKPGWDTGTVLLTGDGTAYRVGAIEERTIGGRLRTLYAVTLHTDLETFRRVIHYELP